MRRQPGRRHEWILEAARTNPLLRVADLAKSLNVSQETIRRDLVHLQANGKLRRHFGGVVAQPVGLEPSWRERLLGDSAQRRETIAGAAVKFVQDGDVIAIGPGATAYTFAKRLASRNAGVTIFTNNLAAATCFARGARARIVVVPGEYDLGEGCTTGPEAMAFISKFRFDTMFFSVGGLTAEGGSDSVSGLAWTERVMIERTARRILLVDHTKFEKSFFELVCPLSSIQIVVCDRAPPEQLSEALAKANVEIVVAPALEHSFTPFGPPQARAHQS